MSAPPLEVFAALADPTRQRMLTLLADHDHGSAAALTGPLALTRQAVEKHLRVLERAGVVARRRDGRRVSYAVRSDTLRTSAAWLDELARGWDRRLAAVKQAAEAQDAAT